MVEYHEDGSVFEVEVLEDTSDAEWERYKLKITAVLQVSFLCPGRVGEVYDVEAKRGCCFSGMWHLYGYTPKAVKELLKP